MSARTRVRSRVRAQWLALAAALVVLAGVLVAWALTDAADRVSVVQVARAVRAGEVIQEDDLTIAGVAFDHGVQGLVPAAATAHQADLALDRSVSTDDVHRIGVDGHDAN